MCYKIMTQKQIIIKWLEYKNEWIPAYKMRSVETPYGWLGFQADRRCRELAHEGKIEHKIDNGYAYYRAKEQLPPLPQPAMNNDRLLKLAI